VDLLFACVDELVVDEFFQGPSSKNPLAYRWYNAEEEILGKKMKVLLFSCLYFLATIFELCFYGFEETCGMFVCCPEFFEQDWFRFSVAFWHTFRGTGGDPFGAATKYWPWEDGTNSVSMAKRRMRANFEFLKKLGVDWWCFHDRDIAPDGTTLEVTRASELTPFCFTLKLQSALLPGVINHFGPDISFAACCFLWYLITLFCSCWPNVNLFQS